MSDMDHRLFMKPSIIFLFFAILLSLQVKATERAEEGCAGTLSAFGLGYGIYVTATNKDLSSFEGEKGAKSFVGEKHWLKPNFVRRISFELKEYWGWRGQGSGVLVPLVEADRPLKNHFSYSGHERFQRDYGSFLESQGRPPERLNLEKVYSFIENFDRSLGGRIIEKKSQKELLFDRAFLVYAPVFFDLKTSEETGLKMQTVSGRNSKELRMRSYFHFSDSLYLIIEYASILRNDNL